MNYLNPFEVYETSIVKIEHGTSFEGYARLIRAEGLAMPFMDPEEKRVLIRQRWLIEWVGLDDISSIKLTSAERFTQLSQQGHRTHRDVEHYAGPYWEDVYSNEDKDYEDQSPKPIDDFGGLF